MITGATNPTYAESSSPGRTERSLLILAGVFVLAGFLSLWIINDYGLSHWIPFVSWVVCAVSGTALLESRLPDRDPILFPIIMLLSGWGLVLIDRLAPSFADRQSVWLIVATAALLVSATFPHVIHWLRIYRYTLLIGGLSLLLATILLGSNPSGFGPELWLRFGPIFIQPSELLKIILVVFLASYLGEHYPALRAQTAIDGRERLWFSARIFGPILLMWSLSIIILVWQRDLGTAVLFFAVFLVLLYIASGQTLILFSGAGLIALATFVAYRLFQVVQLRVDIWLNPWLEADGRAFQIVQSLMAFGAGGVFGQGVGQGYPGYIPVVHSDFIFSAVGEEWGFVGIVAIVACITIFIMRGLATAAINHVRPFHVLLGAGLSTLIGVQSLLIMAGVLKLIPLTGVTLPYMSYGGSSLVVSFIIGGLLLRLSSGAK